MFSVKNITLEKPGHFVYGESLVHTKLQPGEALVRVKAIGICGTDYHAFNGRQPFFSYPRILGHELGIEVAAIAEGESRLRVGDKCAVEPYLYCGSCQPCRMGKTNCCENLKVLGVHTHGGMQELMTIPAKFLHPSSKLQFTQLALVETLGIGYHAVQRSGLNANDQVLVIGAGPIGLSALEFARQAEKTVVMDFDVARNRFCVENNYASLAITPEGDALSNIRQAFDGQLPTIVFDATGNPASMQAAFHYCAHGGKLVFVGLYPGEISFSDPEFHRRELTLLATRNSRSADFGAIIQSMEMGQINTGNWITHQLDFSDFIPQFTQLLTESKSLIKAIVRTEP